MNSAERFLHGGPFVRFVPDDAVVTGVTNVSKDVNDHGVKLDLVRHTDAKGVSRSLPAAMGCSPVLEPGMATQFFDGLTVKGKWKVRAVCISKVLLDESPVDIHVQPARIELSIAWTQ